MHRCTYVHRPSNVFSVDLISVGTHIRIAACKSGDLITALTREMMIDRTRVHLLKKFRGQHRAVCGLGLDFVPSLQTHTHSDSIYNKVNASGTTCKAQY